MRCIYIILVLKPQGLYEQKRILRHVDITNALLLQNSYGQKGDSINNFVDVVRYQQIALRIT